MESVVRAFVTYAVLLLIFRVSGKRSLAQITAFDFILLNYANPDMVGHTGVLDAATRAVEAVDSGLGEIWEAVQKKGGAMIVTADHGNCETMMDAEGNPHTAHTTNPVPLVLSLEPTPRGPG